MSLWVVRAGKFGEHENHFFTTNGVYLTWRGMEATSLEGVKDWDAMRDLVRRVYPESTPAQVGKTAGQFWAFAIGLTRGDIVITPRKQKPAIAIGEVVGDYAFNPNAAGLYQHSRSIKWLNLDVPRTMFGQDLLYSFGAFTTICSVSRNDAEARVRRLIRDGFHSPDKAIGPAVPSVAPVPGDPQPVDQVVDLATLARDQVAQFLQRHYKGHALARLVAALLEAQGYTTYVSPEGPDKGIDILAAPGTLGFGRPRICVQVKSGDAPVDRPTLDQLVGTMSNVGAEQGLLVSWGGFKGSVDRETASQFFKVRLWDSEALVESLFAHYDKLPDDLRAELPLKRIWALALTEEVQAV